MVTTITQAQLLDELTSLQQSSLTLDETVGKGVADSKVASDTGTTPDNPSLYNEVTDPNNSTSNLLASIPNSELDTAELITEEIATITGAAEQLGSDSNVTVQTVTASVEFEAAQSTVFLSPIGTNSGSLDTAITTNGGLAADGTVSEVTQTVQNLDIQSDTPVVGTTTDTISLEPITENSTLTSSGVAELIDTVENATTPQEPSSRTVVSVNTEELVDVVTDVLAPVVTTVFSDAVTRVNDLEAKKELVTTTRTYTDTSVVTTDVTTTSTLITRTTYSDGTVETVTGTPVITETTSDALTLTVREEVISTTLEDPTLVITYETMVDSVTGDTAVETTFSDSIARENDLTNNKETVTVTREYTDVKTTPTTETTTVTPVYTYTYTDGTVEVEREVPTVDEVVTYDILTETRVDIISTGTEEPVIVTTYETVIVSVTSDTAIETTFEDSTVRENDLTNNKETVIVTREYTDIKTTPTVETTTITPIYTITYTDGTVETERGTPVSNDIITYDVVTETREEIVSTTLEDPTLVITYETIVDSVTGDTVIETTFSDDTVRENDLINNKETVTVTREYTDVKTTPTVETTTVTPIYTYTYTDGTVETERGTSVSNDITTYDVVTELREEIVSTTLEDPTLVITYETVVDSVTGNTAVETTFSDSTVRENDLINNKETVTVTRIYTDVKTTPTTETTTVTPIHTYTYTDGTIETERLASTVDEVVTYDILTETREDVISIGTEEPTIITTYETVIASVTDDTIVETTFKDSTIRENDLINNKETVTVTREYTDVKTTPTVETTTVTPIYTITYTDGTIETERGTSVSNDITTYDVVTELREEVVSTTLEDPTLVITYETIIDSVTGNTAVETTFSDTTTRENDLVNNKETVTITREYTDVKTTPTVETTTIIPVYTITYTDGTVETERGTPVSSEITTNDIVTETREEIVATTLEDPVLVITYETVVDSVTGETTVETTYSDSTVRENDLDNNKETVTVTRTYTDVKTTPTTETTTTTPIYTYTYTDGTVEVERQTPTVNEVVTYDVVTETRIDVVSTGTEEPTIVTTYEIVETVVVADPVTTTVTGDTDIDKVLDEENDRWVLTTTVEYTDTTTVDTTKTITTTPIYTITYTDGTVETERGTSVVAVNTTTAITVDTRTETVEVTYEPFLDNNGHGNNQDGEDDSNPGQGSGGPNDNKDGVDEDEGANGNTDDKNPGSEENGKNGNNGGDNTQSVIEEPVVIPVVDDTSDVLDIIKLEPEAPPVILPSWHDLVVDLNSVLPNKVNKDNYSDWVNLVNQSDGDLMIQVDLHSEKGNKSSGWVDHTEVPGAAGQDAFLDLNKQTIDFQALDTDVIVHNPLA